MSSMILVLLAAAASVFSAMAFVLNDNRFFFSLIPILAIIGVILWRVIRPWWIGSVLFGFVGISQLLAKFWLRLHGRPSEPALDTFGPGFIVMAVFFLLLNRRFARHS